MHAFMYVYAYVCICMCLYIWMCAVCIVHVQDTYTNVYVQDTYTNVYRTHMHMHAYMHAYIHTLVGSGPLFPQSVLQCLCSCAAFRRILCSIAICVCVECNRDHDVEKTNRSKPSLHLRRRKPWPLPTVRFLPQQPNSKEARSYQLYPADDGVRFQ